MLCLLVLCEGNSDKDALNTYSNNLWKQLKETADLDPAFNDQLKGTTRSWFWSGAPDEELEEQVTLINNHTVVKHLRHRSIR